MSSSGALSGGAGFGGCGIEAFGSKDNVLEENTVTMNPTGIRFRASGVVASTGNTIRGNVVTLSSGNDVGNTRGGVNLQGGSTTSNLIAENQIVSNVRGIMLTSSPVGNTFAENTIAMNECGVKGSIAGNVFSENTFVNNTSDFCP